MAEGRELRAELKQLHDHLVKTADNVGTRFPNEARKIHYGHIEHRPIYGEASPEEAKSLIEEGVEVGRCRCCGTTGTSFGCNRDHAAYIATSSPTPITISKMPPNSCNESGCLNE